MDQILIGKITHFTLLRNAVRKFATIEDKIKNGHKKFVRFQQMKFISA